MEIEILIENGTKVYNYVTSSSGNTTVGSLKRIDNQKGYTLDLYPDEKISLQYQIASVQDPNSKTTSFSKSFFIPGTARNNLAMGYAYNPLVDDAWRVGTAVPDTANSEYDVTFRNAYLTVDGVQTFTGTLEILNAKIQNGQIVSYEVFFLASEASLLDLWDQVQLPELSFSNQYPAITGSPSNFYNAMANTDADASFNIGATAYEGFTFAYPDWGFPDAPLISAATGAYPYLGYNTSELTTVWGLTGTAPSDPRECSLRFGYNVLPYQYLKSLVDKMFTLAGYTYDSTFFNSVDFRKMLMLYYDQSKIPSNLFMKLASTNPGTTVSRSGLDSQYFADQDGTNLVTNILDGDYNNQTVPSAFIFDSGRCEDLYGVYQGDGIFNFPVPGTWTIRVKAWPGILFGWNQTIGGCLSGCSGGGSNPYPTFTYPVFGPNSTIDFRNDTRNLTVSKSIAGLPGNPFAEQYRGTYVKGSNTYCQFEYRVDASSPTLDFTITTVSPNEEWTLRMTTDASQYYAAPVAAGCPTFPTSDRLYRPFCDLVVEDVSVLRPNWSQTVPNISCKEFFNNLVKHFNLFVQINAAERKVIIDDRDNFFTNGSVQDWSSKVDLTQDRVIENFTPPKNVIMKFTQSDNWLDVNFRGQQNESEILPYGSLRIVNNYGNGDLVIETPFSPPTQYYAQYWQLDTSGGFSILVPNGENIKFPQTVGSNTYYVNIPVLSLYPKQEDGREQVETSPMFIVYNNGFVTNPVKKSSSGSVTNVFASISTLSNSGILTNASGTRAAHVVSVVSDFTATTGNKSEVLLFSNTLPAMTAQGYRPTGYNTALQNTMYNKYWENYLENQQDTKIYRVQAYLTNRDISLFEFRNPVFLDLNGDGQYYIVNSINVDVTGNGKSTLELYTFNPLYFNFSVDNSIPEYPYEPIAPSE
jgi:hypothetical protein